VTTKRPTTITIAEVLLAIFCLTSLIPVAVDLPDNGPPPIVIYVGYVLGALGLVMAAGLWLRKRWGTWLAIVVSPVSLLSAAPGISFASSATLRIGAVIAGGTSELLVLHATYQWWYHSGRRSTCHTMRRRRHTRISPRAPRNRDAISIVPPELSCSFRSR